MTQIGTMRDTIREFPCGDCGWDTSKSEYYMVDFDLWRRLMFVKPVQFLCIGCLEKRLGRKLTPFDFIDARVNTLIIEHPYFPNYYHSKRLRNRLGI